MKLYKVTRTDTWGYDDFDSMVVCAESEEAALAISPSDYGSNPYGWTQKENLRVQDLGIAHEDVTPGLVLASFNAG